MIFTKPLEGQEPMAPTLLISSKSKWDAITQVLVSFQQILYMEPANKGEKRDHKEGSSALNQMWLNIETTWIKITPVREL